MLAILNICFYLEREFIVNSRHLCCHIYGCWRVDNEIFYWLVSISLPTSHQVENKLETLEVMFTKIAQKDVVVKITAVIEKGKLVNHKIRVDDLSEVDLGLRAKALTNPM